MKSIDLFSGIGGFGLAASWVWGNDLEIVSFVEIDKFCQKVLNKNFPGVPIHDDIKAFDGTKYRGTIDLITGGFPCQPYSIAGKQKGKEDDRALWSEMFRIISEVKPTWIIGENVANFVNMGLDDSISDLEGKGYEVQSFIIPACAQNAPHRRDRIWIVAYKKGNRINNPEFWKTNIGRKNSHAPDTSLQGLQRGKREQPLRHSRLIDRNGGDKRGNWTENWLEVATRLCRVDDGVSDRVHRLKSLGNAIVPQVVYPIMMAIKNPTFN